jgi:hypothetical protein
MRWIKKTGRTCLADNKWRYCHMDLVNEPGGQKSRMHHSATFNHKFTHSSLT